MFFTFLMKKKFSVTFINEGWDVIIESDIVSSIPRKDELVFLEANKQYFKVVDVVHYINNKHGVFIILKEIDKNLQKKLDN